MSGRFPSSAQAVAYVLSGLPATRRLTNPSTTRVTLL